MVKCHSLNVGRETLHTRHKVGAKSPGVGAWVSLESLLGQPRGNQAARALAGQARGLL